MGAEGGNVGVVSAMLAQFQQYGEANLWQLRLQERMPGLCSKQRRASRVGEDESS